MTIFNLQILRGLAALGVVFYHTDFRLPGDWHTEFFGVSTFFVISGFIMCFITRDADGSDAHPGGFSMKRAIRIVPLYWVCTFALLVLSNRPPITHHVDPLLAWVSTNVPHLLQSLFFVPSEEAPMLGVGWTLNFEVYFYVVFAIALWINRRLAPLIAWAIVYAVIKANDYSVDNFLIKFYSHGYIHYFLYGIALFYVWTLTKDYLPRLPIIIACAAIIVGCYGSQFLTPLLMTGYPSVFAYEVYFPILLVAAALFAASSGADIKWKPLVLIGNASYAIYLAHTIAMEFFRRFTPPWKESLGVTLAVVIGGALIGIAVHLWIERPMLKLIRQYRPARKVELKALVAEKN
jgi:exopolysaccharide production protein ExoZ